MFCYVSTPCEKRTPRTFGERPIVRTSRTFGTPECVRRGPEDVQSTTKLSCTLNVSGTLLNAFRRSERSARSERSEPLFFWRRLKITMHCERSEAERLLREDIGSKMSQPKRGRPLKTVSAHLPARFTISARFKASFSSILTSFRDFQATAKMHHFKIFKRPPKSQTF